jgi:hypothetical protein
MMLHEIVERSYKLFRDYKPERPLDVCTECCMKKEEEARLAAMTVREIPLELLREYNDSAKPEKTRIEEVKHFLPRYLELISSFRFPTHSVELSFSRLLPFNSNEWTKEELQLLTDFSVEFFKHCLSLYPLPAHSERIDSILIMFDRTAVPVEALLNVWEKADNIQSVLHFKDLKYYGFQNKSHTGLSDGFGDNELATKLQQWLQRDSVKKVFESRIEAILLGDPELEEETLSELELLYDMLRT